MVIITQPGGSGGSSGRSVLTADRTYYVATTGSDSNDGLTVGAPFLTLTKAASTVNALDLGGFTVTVTVANGTYTSAFMLKGVKTGNVILTGTNSTGAIISTTSSDAVNASGSLYDIAGFTLTVKDIKVQTTTSGAGVGSYGGSYVALNNVELGACANAQLSISANSIMGATGNFSVSGSAQYLALPQQQSVLDLRGRTITFSNTPAYSVTTLTATYGGIARVSGMTFTNGATVTGVRYAASLNGLIDTNGGGANYIPGNSAGGVATGGQYI